MISWLLNQSLHSPTLIHEEESDAIWLSEAQTEPRLLYLRLQPDHFFAAWIHVENAIDGLVGALNNAMAT